VKHFQNHNHRGVVCKLLEFPPPSGSATGT
jgi:hypothetical protein